MIRKLNWELLLHLYINSYYEFIVIILGGNVFEKHYVFYYQFVISIFKYILYICYLI